MRLKVVIIFSAYFIIITLTLELPSRDVIGISSSSKSVADFESEGTAAKDKAA
jgi:hypothetical protein